MVFPIAERLILLANQTLANSRTGSQSMKRIFLARLPLTVNTISALVRVLSPPEVIAEMV
jgi:hypothetical protein